MKHRGERTRRNVAIVLLALLLMACGRSAPLAPSLGTSAAVAIDGQLLDTGSGRPQVGTTAPNFCYVLPGGVEQQLSDLRGKLVVLNFWATWCTPCKHEMPILQATAATHKETLVVMGVNRIEAPDAIAVFAQQVGVTFPLVVNESGDISDRYGARQLPMTYFINRDGTISALMLGAVDADAITRQLATMR
jgi:cytochrome c biogenesis protein CcmG, thiol:disulfide interchange protein DsbE